MVTNGDQQHLQEQLLEGGEDREELMEQLLLSVRLKKVQATTESS